MAVGQAGGCGEQPSTLGSSRPSGAPWLGLALPNSDSTLGTRKSDEGEHSHSNQNLHSTERLQIITPNKGLSITAPLPCSGSTMWLQKHPSGNDSANRRCVICAAQSRAPACKDAFPNYTFLGFNLLLMDIS